MKLLGLLVFFAALPSLTLSFPAWGQQHPPASSTTVGTKRPPERVVVKINDKALSSKKSPTTAVTLPVDRLRSLVSAAGAGGPTSVALDTQPQSFPAGCGQYPSCSPTPGNNCCDYVKTCNPDLHCANVDWSEYGYDPAPYCKKCDINYDASGGHTVCWCSETPVSPPPAGPGGLTAPRTPTH